MPTPPTFGPYSSWPSVRDFAGISERAFKIYHQRISNSQLLGFSQTQHLFIRQLYLAETSSFAIRLLTSWAMLLQALALVRTRLEHTIVCSYLVHEEPSVGLEPFVKHIPINTFLNAKVAMSDKSLEEHLDFDMSAMRAEAVQAQTSLEPGFDIKGDKFARKWTKHDLRKMAQLRDKMTIHLSPISRDSLERDYLSLYKAASSIVHSDVSAFSSAYMDLFSIQEGMPAILMPLPAWATLGVAFTSHYDVVQVFEVLKFLGLDCEAEFMDLRASWLQSTKKHL